VGNCFYHFVGKAVPELYSPQLARRFFRRLGQIETNKVQGSEDVLSGTGLARTVSKLTLIAAARGSQTGSRAHKIAPYKTIPGAERSAASQALY
jgi:hypothetical protein